MLGTLLFCACLYVALDPQANVAKGIGAGLFAAGSWAAIKIKEKKEKKEQDKEKRRLLRLKALSELRKEVEAHSEDNSDEAKKLREQYNATLDCLYDENGHERDDEEVQKRYKKLPKEMRKRINEFSAMDENSKEMKDVIKEFDKHPFTEKDLNITENNVKADVAKVTKTKKLVELEKEKQEKLSSAKTDEEKQSIEKEYDKKKKSISNFYNITIKEYSDKAENVKSKSNKKDDAKKTKNLEQEQEHQQKIVDGDEEAINKELDKYSKIEFPSDIEKGDLSSEDPEKKKKAEDFLKSKDVDIELYKKYEAMPKKDDGDKIEIDKESDDYTSFIDTVKDTAKKKVEQLKKQISNVVSGKKEGETEPKAEGDDKNSKKEVDDKDTNDDETEEEVKNSKFDDGEPEDEAEGEDEKKKQDPHKVWKRKSYKRGDKTFKTKSYYNKKGSSISKKDFQAKVQAYEKNNKKSTGESISNYLQDKLVLERFYPQDIVQSKQFKGLDLSAFIKSRIEV